MHFYLFHLGGVEVRLMLTNIGSEAVMDGDEAQRAAYDVAEKRQA